MVNLKFEEQLIIATTQSIIAKYGAVLSEGVIAEIFGLNEVTIRNKFSQGAKDLPSYTQLKGKRVVMANDLAEFMIKNEMKF
ncbi:hypothetical protein [Helicobacter japonicus]|uniref:hypothetical protein n=1 Tax=Helicobacter japonicus TaxID=425400 RepID=UPI0025D7E7F0|nr:hypothetical protein [Helicobacter japonicus]